MNSLHSSIPGLQIVSSLGNEAGNGIFKYTALKSAQKHIAEIRVFDTNGAETGVWDYASCVANISINNTHYSYNLSTNGNVHISVIAQSLADAITNPLVTKSVTDNVITLTSVNDEALTIAANITGTKHSQENLTATNMQQGTKAVQATISWQSPHDTEGLPVPAKEGIQQLYSANGTAWVKVNVTVDLLPVADQSENVAIVQNQVVKSKDWFFRRSGAAENAKNLVLDITLANGDSYNLTVADSTATLNLPVENRPVTAQITLAEGVAGDTQTETLIVQFDDTVNGRTSYARINITVSGTQASQYNVTHNDPAAERTLRNQAVDRLRNGAFTGDVMDQIRVITSDDGQAELAKTMLDAGTNYSELVEAGFSSAVATQLLAAYFTVPSGVQAIQTEALSKLAVIRGMGQTALVAFFSWAETNGIALPIEPLRDITGRPGYSESDITAISHYIDSL